MDKIDREYIHRGIKEQQKKLQKDLKRRKIFRNILKVAAVAVVFAVIIITDLVLDQSHMPHGLSIDGVNVSGLSTEKAAELVEEAFQDTELVFTENGEELYRTTLGDAGFSLDETALDTEMKQVQSDLWKSRPLLESPRDITIDYTVDTDEAALDQTVDADNYQTALERESSSDAYLQYDEESEEYILIPSWQGDAIDEDNLRTVLLDTVDESLQENLIPGEITVKIDVNSYETVHTTENEEELVEGLSDLNDRLSQYKNTTVVYTFGEETVTLDSDTILSWLTISLDGIDLNENYVREYVAALADRYDTIYEAREFTTTSGDVVLVESNEYGYRIDQDAEYAQLMQDIDSGTEIRRDPVYDIEGMQRNGTDDLAGSYIEVSITQQHLWLYKDYDLITETDIVSGQPTEERATMEGAWPIAYKAYDYTLSSDYYGYETHVTYWMPFSGGQGLHDATWQSSFGGTRYQTSAGSHGCINLPYDAAGVIYNNIEAGYPIIIYSN